MRLIIEQRKKTESVPSSYASLRRSTLAATKQAFFFRSKISQDRAENRGISPAFGLVGRTHVLLVSLKLVRLRNLHMHLHTKFVHYPD